jgi:hypothetical protein
MRYLCMVCYDQATVDTLSRLEPGALAAGALASSEPVSREQRS